MTDQLSLEAIAQLAIALMGFSGLIAMIRSGPVHSWHPRVRLSFWFTLDWSIATVFFCALPSMLRPFGVEGWLLPCFLIGIFQLSALAAMVAIHLRLSARGFPTQNAPLWVPTILIPLGAGICALGSAAGWLGAPGLDWYRFAVLACLFEVMPPFLASFRVRAEESAS